jgi:RNA polymerase sigma-70 factor (ECF subfamily)
MDCMTSSAGDSRAAEADLDWAERSCAGVTLPLQDREQLGAMLAHLEPRLAAVALKFTRDREAACDVVQNAFEKVLRHGASFQGQSRVSTWVHRIVTNEALMWLRSQRRRREEQPAAEHGGIPFAVDATPNPVDALDSHQQLHRLRKSLHQLPAAERDVVRCCALDGQTYTEYGRRRGLHPGAVKSRAFRARRRLAELLED